MTILQVILISAGTYLVLAFLNSKIWDSIRASEFERDKFNYIEYHLNAYEILFNEIILVFNGYQKFDLEGFKDDYPQSTLNSCNKIVYHQQRLLERGEENYFTDFFIEIYQWKMRIINDAIFSTKHYVKDNQFIFSRRYRLKDKVIDVLKDDTNFEYYEKEFIRMEKEIKERIKEIKEKYKIKGNK